ncbi:inositol monophosphatase family protein [Streptomyces sp. NPDC046866]|uniref:inositol monophosphatase family protein n=1 Tax=Streptomyces sp. NPDC046866 TaxID=3154921 RepID=UPI00345426D3
MGKELSELGQLAFEAAQRGRDVIAAAQSEGGFAVRTKSSHRDLVTDVDTAAERAVTDFLRQHRPHDAILGEEGGQQEGSGNVRWIIDPIDGTANFAHGRSDFAVAVAAEVNGVPAASSIIRPATGRWIACDETGTIVSGNGTPAVSATDELSAALVSVSVSISEERRPLTLSTLIRLIPEVQDFRRTGSTSCDLFDIATGALDAYVGIGTKPWDVAAGWAAVQAAGGRCLQFPVADGQTAYVLGTPAVAERAAALVEEHAAVFTATQNRTRLRGAVHPVVGTKAATSRSTTVAGGRSEAPPTAAPGAHAQPSVEPPRKGPRR